MTRLNAFITIHQLWVFCVCVPVITVSLYNYCIWNVIITSLCLVIFSQTVKRLAWKCILNSNANGVVMIFSGFLSLTEGSIYQPLRRKMIKKEPQVLTLCSSQPSNSPWPHANSQCAWRHPCLFPFSRSAKSPALTVQVSCTDTSQNEKSLKD